MGRIKRITLILIICLTFSLFSGCSLNEKNYTPTDVSYFNFTKVEGGWSISAKSDVELPENIAIPMEYESEDVIAIADQGFYSQKIKTVKIPNTIKIVGSIAFSSCPNLERVTFSEGLETIGDYAFYSCTKLKNAELTESLVSIGISAFQNDAIVDVDLRKNVKSIGKNCFKDCKSLGSVYIGKSVEIIGENAFEGCPNNISFIVSDLNTVYELKDGIIVNK